MVECSHGCEEVPWISEVGDGCGAVVCGNGGALARAPMLQESGSKGHAGGDVSAFVAPTLLLLEGATPDASAKVTGLLLSPPPTEKGRTWAPGRRGP